MNSELSRVQHWFNCNKLSLNSKKTSYMCFGRAACKRNSLYQLVLNGEQLRCVNVNKFLGVTIDDQLNWKPHIDELTRKLNRNAGVIYKIRYKINASVTLKLYDSMILSH